MLAPSEISQMGAPFPKKSNLPRKQEVPYVVFLPEPLFQGGSGVRNCYFEDPYLGD